LVWLIENGTYIGRGEWEYFVMALKARLHDDKYRDKLAGFKEQEKIFCIFKKP
jgi:hypothetical protein